MAKRFGGFTPEQMGKIIPEMQGMQADEQAKFLASQPGAAARVGKMAELAQQRIGMAVGGYIPQQQQQPQAMAQLDYNRLYQQPNPTQRQPIEVKSLQPNAFATGGTATLATQPVKTAAGTTYKNTYTGGVEAKGSHSTDNDKPGNPPPNTPNTTGGFDDVQTATTVQPTITQSINSSTPIEGLPTAPEGVTEADYAPFRSQIAGGTESNVTGIDTMFATGNLPENPTDYEITGSSRNWTITYGDGTTLKSPYRKRASIENEAANIAKVLQQYKESEPFKAYGAAQEQYTQQLDLYRQGQYTQAGEALTDVGASLDTAQTAVSQEQGALNSLQQQLSDLPADDPQRESLQKIIDDQQIKVTQAKARLVQASANVARVGTPSTTELQSAAITDPSSLTTKADVALTSQAQADAGMIAEGTGQAPAEAAKATQTEAKIAADVPLAEEFEAAGMTPKEAAAEVASVMSKLTAVTGKPSAEALADAATMSTSELAQLGLTAEQLSRAQRVEGVAPLEVTPEMQVTSAVDFERAKAETNFAAATGVPSTEATVQGQLTGLLEQFEGGDTPAWAAGAMRAATSALATRGLGASSMAGQAIVQAAMESALPIAMADAQTRASFEAQNLSNRQQAAVFAAEQRAKFLGMEFDQEFQSRVQNAARIADVAKINFTAEQQIALENARMAQTVDIANLDARNAKVMADAAAMSQLDMTNLNNRQQANVQRAQAFLDFDMTSMTNQQQVAMFKAQSLASVYTSDTAAANAARQFNASSDDQVGMFFSNLQNNINQFNNEQFNSMEKFNAGEANALSQFNAVQQNTRDQFNAQNQLVVAQANAQWSQAITTMDNAALNQANRDEAIAANNFTTTGYNNAIQRERDTLAWAWQSAENASDRDAKIAVAKITESAEDDSGSALSAAAGTFMGAIASNAADIMFGK
ncbi:hypothetical protein N9095_00770 [bacterium]|nr:hypothetical protein [bacterium]